jgi:hypothetical protein
VLSLFDQSLSRGGYFALGRRETLSFTALGDDAYQEVGPGLKIYRKGH